jgi:ATP-dependent helicase HrpA
MPVCARVIDKITAAAPTPEAFAALNQLQEQLEEWRVATFAQELARKGAPGAKEIEQAIKQLSH